MRWRKSLSAALALLLLCGCAAGEGRLIPDEEGMYLYEGSAVEDPGALDEQAVRAAAAWAESLRAQLFPEGAVYYAAIPDKSDFAREQTDAFLDHARIAALLAEELPAWTAIDLREVLSLEDYYRTDRHWRQERLLPVLRALGGAMGFAVSEEDFTAHTREGFLGSYGDALGGMESESLGWLSSAAIDRAELWDLEDDGALVYDERALEGGEPFDFFLSGAAALQTLTDPEGTSGRTLVVLRDSFAAPLAPLLLAGYDRVVLVDARFVSAALLPQYVSFEGADVLFLLSDRILSTAGLLK